MLKIWDIPVPLPAGEEMRRAYLYLPNSYTREPERRYPVLYMFDGHNVFLDADATYGKSWGLGEYLDFTDTPLIVAAVECSHDPDNGRLSEYSPFTFIHPELGRVNGRGRQTMNWFVNVFKPCIDRHCRTLPDRRHTFIAGSSMGGLMSLFALLEYNRTFSRAAALSPSLWVSPDRVTRLIRYADLRPDTVLYMDYGEQEMHGHPGMQSEFTHAVKLLLSRNVLLTSRIVPGGEHCEASWERQLPFAVETLMYDLYE